MKVFRGIAVFVYGAGLIGNGLLLLYVEWTFVRESFLQLFNPLLHLEVLLTLVRLPLFWILTATTGLGYLAMLGAQKLIDSRNEGQTETSAGRWS